MSNFSESTLQQVWEKAQKVQGADPNEWRKDECSAWIHRAAYGKQSDYGWNVDHIHHVSKGGSDAISNLRPLHWENNTARGDGRLTCIVRSSGNRNVK